MNKNKIKIEYEVFLFNTRLKFFNPVSKSDKLVAYVTCI